MRMSSMTLRKDFERQKAISKIVMIMLLLSTPTLLLSAQSKTSAVLLVVILSVIALLYARICRLNFKLAQLTR